MAHAAQELLRMVEENLKKSEAWKDDEYALKQDSDGELYLQVSEDATPATGERVAIIRIKADDMRATGAAAFTGAANLAIPQVRPHVIEIAFEEDVLSPQEHISLADAISLLGTKARYYQEDAGTVASVSSIDEAKFQFEIRGNRLISGISQ